jgi:hypothetical protein
MSNYFLWHQHGEVQPAVADESDGNDDIDQMDDMVADIKRGYDLESAEFLQAPCRLRRKSVRWHRCDRVASCDPSYGIQIKVQLFKLVLQ